MSDNGLWPGEDETELDPTNPAHERIWNDSAEGAVILDADPVAHSEAAIRVLLTEGVDAYRRWLAEREKTEA